MNYENKNYDTNQPSYRKLSKKLEEACLDNPQAAFIECLMNDGSVRTCTYGSTLESCKEIRILLEGIGCREHDRIVLLLPYSPAALVGMIGLFYSGAIAIPIDYSLPIAEIRRLIEDVDAAAIITDQPMLDRFDDAFVRINPIFVNRTRTTSKKADPELIGAAPEPNNPTAEQKILDIEFSLSPQGLQEARTCDIYDNEPNVSAIVFSSGTTNRMKAICIQSKLMIDMYDNHEKFFRLPRKRSIASLFPHFHIGAFILLFSQFFSHNNIYMSETFDVLKFPELLTTFEPDSIAVVPAVLDVYRAKILASLESRGSAVEAGFKNLLSLAFFVRKRTRVNVGAALFKPIRNKAFGKNTYIFYFGGGGIKKETYDFFYALGIKCFINVYCSTEVCFPFVQTAGTDGYTSNAAGKINGSENAGVYVAIKNPDTKDLGEICVSSPYMFTSYFRDSERTRRAFNDEGLFKTGDLGYFDRNGLLFVVGRKKDIILMRNGKKMSPDDLEDYYKEMLDVKDLAVCGITDSDGFDNIVLFVVREPGSEEGSDEFRTRLNKAIASESMRYRPFAIEFVDSIPKTTSGKTKRYLLKESYAQSVRSYSGKANQDTIPETPRSSESIEAILAEVSNVPIQDVVDDSELARDLGIDSLDMFEIQSRIDATYGVDISNRLAVISTVGDLKSILMDAAITGTPKKDVSASVSVNYDEYPKERSASDMLYLKTALKIFSTVYKNRVHARRKEYDVRPCIVVANHTSILDTPALLYALRTIGFQPREMVYLARFLRFFDGRISHKTYRAIGRIPIDRFNNPRPGYEALERCLKNGYTVLIHPEGLLSQDGNMGKFKNGAFKLAIDNNVPVLPVRIEGAYEILPDDLLDKTLPKLLNKGKRFEINIYIGDYIYPDTSNPSELAERAKRAIAAL